jgi:hypothetical protein
LNYKTPLSRGLKPNGTKGQDVTAIGYARVSTTDQELLIQEAALKAAGCEVIRAEKRSGTTTEGRDELEEAIAKWINHRNANPKPFVWTATPRSITLKRNRAKKALASLAAGCK